MIKTPLFPVCIAPPQEKTKKGAAIQLIASTLYPEPGCWSFPVVSSCFVYIPYYQCFNKISLGNEKQEKVL